MRTRVEAFARKGMRMAGGEKCLRRTGYVRLRHVRLHVQRDLHSSELNEGCKQRKRHSRPLPFFHRQEESNCSATQGRRTKSVRRLKSPGWVVGCSALCAVSCNARDGQTGSVRRLPSWQVAPRNVRANNSSPVSDTAAAAGSAAVTQPLTKVPGTVSIRRPINTCRQASRVAAQNSHDSTTPRLGAPNLPFRGLP